MDLKNKVIVITGASSGIGEATAHLLAADGAKLVLMARREERMQELAQKLMDEHKTDSMVIKLDVTDREAVLEAFEEVKKNYGRIDVLINNAGLMPVSFLDKLKIDEWDRMIDVNLKGLLYCVDNYDKNKSFFSMLQNYLQTFFHLSRMHKFYGLACFLYC